MRDLTNVQVDRGVTHVLAPRDPTMLLRLSEVELPLTGGVNEILSAQVDAGLHDVQAQAAVFADRREDRPSAIFAKLLGPNPDIVGLSQKLAQILYSIVEGDARISDGTLAVLLCTGTDSVGATVSFPAVLKLDPSATLHTVVDVDPTSQKARVRFEVDPTTLPSKNERIQKCVFVQTVDPGVEYEMLVVDRQRRQEVVSRFWVGEYLGAEIALDAPERTKRLYKALQRARNEVEQELDAHDLAALDQVIAGAVVQATVNVDALIAGLPVSESVRSRVNDTVSRALPDREFELDPEIARQFLRRRTFRADNDLRVTVRTEFEAMLKVDDLEGGTSETRLRRISFETRTWKES